MAAKHDPRNIPDDLVERAAIAMQGANAISRARFELWEKVEEREKQHWLYLAKAALIAISIHTNKWPELSLQLSEVK